MSLKISFKKGKGGGIRQKLRLLVSPKARAAAADATADVILDLVDEGFDKRQDPHGRRWAPRKDRLPHPILEKTRDMRTNYFTVVRGSRVVLENNTPYNKYHQTGTRHMVARPVAPTGPLPHAWKERIDVAVAKALDKL